MPLSQTVAQTVAASQKGVLASGRFVGSSDEDDSGGAGPGLPEWALDAGITRRDNSNAT